MKNILLFSLIISFVSFSCKQQTENISNSSKSASDNTASNSAENNHSSKDASGNQNNTNNSPEFSVAADNNNNGSATENNLKSEGEKGNNNSNDTSRGIIGDNLTLGLLCSSLILNFILCLVLFFRPKKAKKLKSGSRKLPTNPQDDANQIANKDLKIKDLEREIADLKEEILRLKESANANKNNSVVSPTVEKPKSEEETFSRKNINKKIKCNLFAFAPQVKEKSVFIHKDLSEEPLPKSVYKFVVFEDNTADVFLSENPEAHKTAFSNIDVYLPDSIIQKSGNLRNPKSYRQKNKVTARLKDEVWVLDNNFEVEFE